MRDLYQGDTTWIIVNWKEYIENIELERLYIILRIYYSDDYKVNI